MHALWKCDAAVPETSSRASLGGAAGSSSPCRTTSPSGSIGTLNADLVLAAPRPSSLYFAIESKPPFLLLRKKRHIPEPMTFCSEAWQGSAPAALQASPEDLLLLILINPAVQLTASTKIACMQHSCQQLLIMGWCCTCTCTCSIVKHGYTFAMYTFYSQGWGFVEQPIVVSMSGFESLSIKQLKHILNAKCMQLPGAAASDIRAGMSLIVEKSALVQLCKDNIKDDEIQKLLATTAEISPSHPSVAAPAAAQRPSTTGAGVDSSKPRFSANQYRSQVANQMGSPDQLRYQAACMRRDPSGFRRSNPEAANFSDAQIDAMAANLEQMASDPAKLKAYQEQVSKMSDEDIERLQRIQHATAPVHGGTSVAANIDRFIAALQGDPKDAKAMLKSIPGLPIQTNNVSCMTECVF